MKKISKRIISLVLVLAMVIPIGVFSASAASSTSWSDLGVSSSTIIKCYLRGTKNVTTFTTNALKTKSGSVYVSDEITVKQIGKNSSGNLYAYISYPLTKGGTKSAYIPLSALTSSKSAGTQMKATAKINNVYRRANNTVYSKSYISSGDRVYLLNVTSGQYSQVLYEISKGWKLAWIKTADANKHLSSGSSYSSKLPKSLYLTQAGKSTCTLCSAAMMLRARMYLSGSSAWSSITEAKIKSTAWSSGLKWSWTYSISGCKMTVAHTTVSGISVSALKSLLAKHPEGVVLYCGNLPHAVFLTGYSGNTFYCADTISGYSGSNRTLVSSYLGKQYGSQANVLSHVTAYWYVSSYSI